MSTTLDSIGDAVIVTDLYGIVKRMNPIAEELSGWTVIEAINKPFEDVFNIVNEFTGKTIENPVHSILSEKEIVELVDHSVLISKDNIEFHISESGAPIRNKEGEVSGVVLVLRDITDKFILQEQLDHRNKMDAVGELAGGMAHDFNNVLSGILSASQLLKLPKHKLNEKSLKYVEMIIQASIRASNLINKLLTFRRKGKTSTTSLQMNRILDDTVAILERTIDRKISITLNKAASDQTFLGDLSALESAFLNLGINSSQAMPNGGQIRIETDNIYLDQKYCNASFFDIVPGKYIKIDVKDTGSGISQNDQKKIFEPFFTTKEVGQGTGLGLSAVYGTILNHKGIIDVESQINIGTTFSILLPCTGYVEDKIELKKPIVTGLGTILLVDDEGFNRIINSDLLKELGYRVQIAENGREAIEIYQEQRNEIDLILMDFIMPEMNGKEAFHKLREINPQCKVIIASGFTKDENISDLKKIGLAGFIKKPFKIEELSRILNDVLRGETL